MPASTIPLTITPESSQIHGFGYDAATRTLAVEYNSNHERMTYHYVNVAPEVAQELAQAQSKGSFIYKLIKGKYEFGYMPKDTDTQRAAAGQEEA